MHARSSTNLDASADAATQSRALFTQVSIQTLRLRVPVRGATAFFPVTFDEWHFCYAPMLVHAAVVGSKLLSPPRACTSRALVAPPPRNIFALSRGNSERGSSRQLTRNNSERGSKRLSLGDTGGEPLTLLQGQGRNSSGGWWFRRNKAPAASAAAAAAANPNAALSQLLVLGLSPPNGAEDPGARFSLYTILSLPILYGVWNIQGVSGVGHMLRTSRAIVLQ